MRDKFLLQEYFSFLESIYNFKRTQSEELLIPEWIKDGIAFTNNKKVIIFTIDKLESRFETIMHDIQPDKKIPLYTSSYFTLESFLKDKQIDFNSIYSSLIDFNNIIQKRVFYLKEYLSELLR